MKHLLFIKGIYDTIDLFIAALSEAFEDLGFDCYIIDVRDETAAMQQLKSILEDTGLDAVITFNNIGYNLSFAEGKIIWDEQNIRYINILMDHPFHYDHPLRHAPETSVVLCTDQNHVGYLKRFYPHIRQADFIPHAGMEADISEPSAPGTCHLCMQGECVHPDMKERPIEVLYAGGLSRYVAEGLIPDLGQIREFDAFALTKEVLGELMLHPDKTTEQAIEEYLHAKGLYFEDEQLRYYITELRFLDSYATSYFREQSVRLLVENGIPVTVFGGGWEQCEWADHPNFIYGGKVLAPQVLELMNHSKMVLNTMTWYKNGIHDRIINGMLAKAVVVSDTSVYLKEERKRYSKICMEQFSLEEILHLPEQVHQLLEEPDRMQQIAEEGYRYAKKYHTWKQRAEYIAHKYLTEKCILALSHI